MRYVKPGLIVLTGVAAVIVTGLVTFAQEEAPPDTEPFLFDGLEVQPEEIGPGRLEPGVQFVEGGGVIDDISGFGPEDLIGHWELMVFERLDAEGWLAERPMAGRLHYDAAGNMSAQLMPGDPVEAEAGRIRGYMAYYGTYDVDEVAETVTHSVKGSNIAAWVGRDLVRRYRFSGGDLELALEDEDGRVTTRLVWGRLQMAG